MKLVKCPEWVRHGGLVFGNNAHTRGHCDTEKPDLQSDIRMAVRREESIFPFRQVVRRKKLKWDKWERTKHRVSRKQRRDSDTKMHPAHSRVSNLVAFIAGLWDLCFSLTPRHSPVWYSPWQLNVMTNFRVAVWITLQLLNTRPTASMLCLLWTEGLFSILSLELT